MNKVLFLGEVECIFVECLHSHIQAILSLVVNTGIEGWARECHVLGTSFMPNVTPAATFCSKYDSPVLGMGAVPPSHQPDFRPRK